MTVKKLLKQLIIFLCFFCIGFTLFVVNRPITVSVIIPTYNREDWLPYAIDSILNQTFSNFELIVVNDGSTDNTAQILKNYARQDKRIKVITQKNCGVSCARNNGLKSARGIYVSMLDSDDFALPEMLERQVLYMRKHPELVAVSCKTIRLYNPTPKNYFHFFSSKYFRSDFSFKRKSPEINIEHLFVSTLSQSGVCYKKSFLDKYNILYDEKLESAEDYDFYRQIIMNGGLIAETNEPWVALRIHRSHGKDFYRNMYHNSVIVKKRFFAPYWELSGKESEYRGFSWEERCVILQKILDNWTDGGWLKKTDVTDYMAKFCTVH